MIMLKMNEGKVVYLDIVFEVESKLSRTGLERNVSHASVGPLRLESDTPRRIVRLRGRAARDLHHFLHEQQALFGVVGRLGLRVAVQQLDAPVREPDDRYAHIAQQFQMIRISRLYTSI